mgnify:CR=1 FL=1
MPNESKSIKRGMVVVAHADDAEWGCSGTVAQWCRQGSEVIYVICTDGSKGSDDPNMTSVNLAAIRKSEQEARAMRHCGNAIGKAGDRLLSLRRQEREGGQAGFVRRGDGQLWRVPEGAAEG